MFGNKINGFLGTSGGSGGGSGGSTYNGASPSTVTVQQIPAGTSITGLTLVALLQNIYAPYTVPTLAIVSVTATQNYNQLNVTATAVFSWTKGGGTPNLTSAQVQYQRAGDVAWTNITTTTTPSLPSSASPIQASGTVTVNPSTPNNASILFRCIFTDSSQSNTTATATTAFLAYAAPTAALSLAVTPTLQSNKMIRSLATTTSVVISGTITRNSVNVNLSTYIIQRSYNNSSWTDLFSPARSITVGGGTLAANGGNVTDNTQPLNQNAIYIRAFVADTQVPSGQGVSATSSFLIYQPVFFGMTSQSNPALVDLSLLTPVPNGSGAGNVNYTNTATDKVINGLSFAASSNRFCVAYDNSYGALSIFFDTGTNTNLYSPTNFSQSTQVVTFADGTTKTYTVYVYNSVVVSGTYIVNIS